MSTVQNYNKKLEEIKKIKVEGEAISPLTINESKGNAYEYLNEVYIFVEKKQEGSNINKFLHPLLLLQIFKNGVDVTQRVLKEESLIEMDVEQPTGALLSLFLKDEYSIAILKKLPQFILSPIDEHTLSALLQVGLIRESVLIEYILTKFAPNLLNQDYLMLNAILGAIEEDYAYEE